MTQPNPTIDVAKARADWGAIVKPYSHRRDSELAAWAELYGPALLTALEQMQAEIRHRFEYASNMFRNVQHWHGEEAPDGSDLYEWVMRPLGNTPGDTPHADR